MHLVRAPGLVSSYSDVRLILFTGTVNNSIVTGLGGPNLDIPMPSVTDQVATFLSTRNPAPSRSIVVIYVGGNDYAFGGPNVDVRALTISVMNNVGLLAKRGTALYFHLYLHLKPFEKQSGYSSFVISTRPANALLPANANADPATLASLVAYTNNWHGNLTQAINTFRLSRNVSVKLWDWYATVEQARKDALKHGINVDAPCLVGVFGEAPARTLCEDPKKHLL